jgi:serine/threonine protein kinase/tetratricopeptide (TPR) repeat protein
MVECPICHASNPPGSETCFRCSTPFDSGLRDAPTTLDTSYDPEATVAAGAGGATGWSVPVRKSGAHDPSAPLEPGTVVGERYEILKRLGEGGMGAVYKARDRELDLFVALKVIRPELANHPDILRRFKQELILARQVTHKNVIRIFELGMADGRKFITMDYIEGRDLKSILVERGKLPPDETVRIMRQICRGLEAAHAEGVVHRDLKPQNIMLDANGRVWVMDFGLARSMDLVGITRTGALMGTPDYMSPEQARAEKVDARSDLFSLGIIFYEILTGVLPFRADTMMATLLKRVQEKAPPPNSLDPGIPQRLSDVVMKCLEVEVARRYQSASEMLTDLGGNTPSNASVVQTAVAAPDAIIPGSTFGPRYTIESLIGEGGMGTVYKARDNELDRTVALKLVRRELAGDPTSMQRFKQELQLASRISHRNILRIHDLGDVGGVKFISMMFVEGQDLHEVIRECGRMPVARLVNIARQLASALDAAHAEGVVHRDLKPRNVLIDGSDQVYVSDFGLAKSLEAESATMMTRAGEILGTPRYMSPEQAESKPADHRSDLYSFGVILYEMATGDAPFAADSTMQVMYQHVTQKPKDPKLVNPELPDYLARIILKCLEKDPASRYQEAREILQDLEAARPPSRVVRLRIAETSYPKWLMASMAALLLLVAATFAIPSWRNAILGRLEIAPTGTAGGLAPKYLAVLPFKVSGDQTALNYIAEGVVDSLTAQLFPLKSVHVAPPSAVDAAVKKGSMDKIAKDLGVNLLVTGTVQGAGDNVRIMIQVEDVKKGQHLWSGEFTVLRRDLLSAETSIYKQLVTALNLNPSDEDLSRSALRLTGDYGAYELYLKGHDMMRRQPNTKGYMAALNFYDEAIRKDPRFALAYAGRADISMALYFLTKEDSWAAKALSAAEQAKQLNPDLPEVHWALGTVYLQTGRTEESIAEAKLGLELAPNADESYRRLGEVYLAAGRKNEAIAAYEKAAQINPYYWFNFNWLGVACARLGEGDKAIAAFRRVTELTPDWASGYNNLGGAYFQQGKWNEAIAAYEKSLSLEPNGDAYANLGAAFYYLGRYSDAAGALEKAVQMDPASQENIGGLADAYRQLGQRDKAKSNYDTAIKLALKAYEVNTRDAITLGELALYYAKNGDLNRAQNFIAKAREIDANNNVLIYNDAIIQVLSGKPAEALKRLREALQKGYPVEMIRSEPELAAMRSTPEFAKLMKDFSRKAG